MNEQIKNTLIKRTYKSFIVEKIEVSGRRRRQTQSRIFYIVERNTLKDRNKGKR